MSKLLGILGFDSFYFRIIKINAAGIRNVNPETLGVLFIDAALDGAGFFEKNDIRLADFDVEAGGSGGFRRLCGLRGGCVARMDSGDRFFARSDIGF